MKKGIVKNPSTRFAVESAIDASKGDRKTPWALLLKGIPTWEEIALTGAQLAAMEEEK